MNAQEDRPVILHLITSLAAGGGEIQLLKNMQYFDHGRFEHIVVYIRPSSALNVEFENTGVRVECLDPESTIGFVRRAWKLRHFARKNNVRLIHTTNAEADKMGAIAGFLARVPVAATLNSIGYTDEWYKSIPGVNIWKMRYMKFSRMFALRLFVSRFNAVSAVAKSSFVETIGLPESKIDVIYRGVELEKFPRRASQAEQTGEHGSFPRILMVGRLVGEKGQKYAVAAMPQVLKEFPNARLQIVGSGYLADALTRQVKELGLEDSVEMLGYRADIPDLLREADIFLLPSLSEGCPNALLEAMAIGLPSIAAASEAAKEIIEPGKNGLLTPLMDPGAIADAVVRVAGDPELADRLGKAAAEHIANHFSIKRATLALEDFYVRMQKRTANDPVSEYR